VTSAAEGSNRASHTTPGVSGVSSTSWAVSFWADQAATTDWSVSAPTAARQFQVNADGKRTTALVADSAGPIGGTSTGGVTATASHASGTATMWTVVLRAEPLS
jgi:hypothetical protein